jgi:hypothetical protein
LNQFHHTYETPADATARETAAEMALLLKEIQDWQGVILIALGIMIRSGASKASLAQIDEATAEYSKRFARIMNYASSYRLSVPAKNRY